MFTHFNVGKQVFTFFEWKNRWYFVLSMFCKLFNMNQHLDRMKSSLQDYEKSCRSTPRQKTWHVCTDLNTIKIYMKQSNKVKLEDNVMINENLEMFLRLVDNEKDFCAIDFMFFCDYLQTMYQRWEEKKDHITNFHQHLAKVCPFWLIIMEQQHLLEPFINQYNTGKPPSQKTAEKETDDLLHYLTLFKETNGQTKEEKELIVIDEEHDYDICVESSLITNAVVVAEKRKEIKTLPPKKKRRSVTSRDRLAIAAEQDWKCYYCLQTLDECFEVDHIERFCESGNDHHSNLWVICSNCHKKKGEMDRKRQKPHIWSGYIEKTDTEKEQRRQEILSRIKDV